MNRRPGSVKKLIVLILAASFLLVGYTFYKPALKNADKPFIDLSSSVGTAMGNAESAYFANPGSTDDPGSARDRSDTSNSSEIVIVVSDELIKSDAFLSTYIAGFEDVIKSGTFKGKRVVLVDDYAEAKTFRKLIKLIKEAGIGYEIERR